MLGDNKKKKKITEVPDKDALDTLRRWIKQSRFSFGSLKPTLTVRDGTVTVVKIQRGDETIVLQTGENVT